MTKRLRTENATLDFTTEKQRFAKGRLITPDGSPFGTHNHLSTSLLLSDSSVKAINRLFSENAEAKLWGVASRALELPHPPFDYPEYTEPGGTEYVYRELDFWTSGFFPGSLYLLLERQRRFRSHPSALRNAKIHDLKLEFVCKWWTENLHQNAHLSTTHDLGFMIMPWAKLAWELNRDHRAFETLKAAAKTLHSRYSDKVGLIRSWDTCITKRYSFLDPNSKFLTVIDNMMNLSLLFYVASQTGNQAMFEAAKQHARTTQRTHIRENHSTIHLAVFDPANGDLCEHLTNQGYTDTSCWTRGQAWAIAGFAETYHWTHESSFLTTARHCADYFLQQLPESGVPPWDFDAEKDHGAGTQPPDVSAAMITAYGFLLIHKALVATGSDSVYLSSALKLIEATCENYMNPPARFVHKSHHHKTVAFPARDIDLFSVDMGTGDTILNGATINNHEFAPRRWANHGLVYADYYFMLVGNTLLDMGLGHIFGGYDKSS
ncbi:unsaturated glucuronyl hydrolase [Nemania sp. FL0031]|nr:unsaturated glucuronyl hydrolase [Nemania sp. FL0031]